MGRWGNQLYQLMFTLAYARKHRCQAQFPADWAGRELLAMDLPTLTGPLPLVHESVLEPGMVNIDLAGFFQGELFVQYVHRDFIKETLRLKPMWTEVKAGKRIGAHVRRGDYLSPDCRKAGYVVVTDASYRKAIGAHMLSEQEVQWFGDGHATPGPLGMLQDFTDLSLKPIIFRSNSTFAWWAAELAQIHHDAEVYSPVIDGKGGGWQECEFVRGNHPRIHHTTAEMRLK